MLKRAKSQNVYQLPILKDVPNLKMNLMKSEVSKRKTKPSKIELQTSVLLTFWLFAYKWVVVDNCFNDLFLQKPTRKKA